MGRKAKFFFFSTAKVKMLKNELENIEDCRVLYSDLKDLNDWMIHKNPSPERQVKQRRR
jgi:hypothetical protein